MGGPKKKAPGRGLRKKARRGKVKRTELLKRGKSLNSSYGSKDRGAEKLVIRRKKVARLPNLMEEGGRGVGGR